MIDACIHSPASVMFQGQKAVLSLVVPDGVSAVEEIALCVKTPEGERRVRMLPDDGFEGGESYSVYTAAVPAAALAGEELCYHFESGAEHGEEYRVKLIPTPTFPPFVITEALVFSEVCTGLELYNPGTVPVDLFQYELLMESPFFAPVRLPFATKAKENVLPAGEMCFFRWVEAKWLGLPNGEAYGTPEGFLSAAAQKYPATCADIAERGVRVMQYALTEWDEKAGKWRNRKGTRTLQLSYRSGVFYVVPRGEGKEQAVFTLVVSENGRHDSHRDHAMTLRIDAAAPDRATLIDHFAAPTPGFPVEGQPLPQWGETAAPAVIPLSPEGRAYLSVGDLRITFAVVAAGGCDPRVFVQEGEKFIPFAAVFNTDGVYETTVPAALLRHAGGELHYYIEVSGGLYTVSCGSAAAPLCCELTDNVGPAILSVFPADGQVIENERTPHFRARFEDASGVDTRTSSLCVDGVNVTAEANFTPHEVTYRPQRPLAFGAHTIELTLRDLRGNRTYRLFDFTIGNGQKLTPFGGQVHSHSNVSDGEGSYGEAICYARDVGKADFFAVTDHSHYLDEATHRALIRRADAFNRNGEFVTLWGHEMTWTDESGWWGHMNVLNTNWVADDPWHEDMPTFLSRVVKDASAVAMFNHPGEIWGDFGDFENITPALREKLMLCEVRGKAFDRPYALMLSRGWHAAPVLNEDNHHRKWTTESGGMGYVLAPTLTRENILDGIRRRRTYATGDRTLKLRYRVGGQWLGGTLRAPQSLRVEVEVTTEDPRGIGLLQVVTEDNIVVAQRDAGPRRTISWRTTLAPLFDYYYIRILNGDLYTVTAPVWVEERDALSITAFSAGVSNDARAPHAVSVTVQNSGERTMENVTVDFYLSPLSGFDLAVAAPFHSVRVGRLEAGKTHTVSGHFPDAAGARRVSAVVRGEADHTPFADTCYRILTPVRIGKVMLATAPAGEIKNPFAFVELQNLTAAPLSLAGLTLRLWKGVGHAPKPEQTLPLDALTLPPHGAAVLWQRPNAALTVADFNAHYGTALVEGETLFLMERPLLYPTENGQRLDVMAGEEELTFVTFGNYCGAPHATEDKPLCYGASDVFTARQLPLNAAALSGAPVRPGEWLSAQRPPVFAATPHAALPAARARAPRPPRAGGRVRTAAGLARLAATLRRAFKSKK